MNVSWVGVSDSWSNVLKFYTYCVGKWQVQLPDGSFWVLQCGITYSGLDTFSKDDLNKWPLTGLTWANQTKELGWGLFTTEVRDTLWPSSISFKGSISNLLLSLVTSAKLMLSKSQICRSNKNHTEVQQSTYGQSKIPAFPTHYIHISKSFKTRNY